MSLLGILRRDHRRFLSLIGRLDGAVFQPAAKRRAASRSGESSRATVAVLRDLVRDLSRHEEIEMNLLFPALRERSPDVEPILEVLAAEHAAIDEAASSFLREASRRAERPPGWLVLSSMRLTNLLKGHILREETEVFAAAERFIPSADLERLGRRAVSLVSTAG